MLQRIVKSIFILIGIIAIPSVGMSEPKSKSANGGSDTFTTIMSTKFDFSETPISGAAKAPDGFFLQGKQPQSLSQMVKLRPNFKKELRNSRSGVMALGS